jgi:hypothetical protein
MIWRSRAEKSAFQLQKLLFICHAIISSKCLLSPLALRPHPFSYGGSSEKISLTWARINARSSKIKNIPEVVFSRETSFVFTIFLWLRLWEKEGGTDGLRRLCIYVDMYFEGECWPFILLRFEPVSCEHKMAVPKTKEIYMPNKVRSLSKAPSYRNWWRRGQHLKATAVYTCHVPRGDSTSNKLEFNYMLT